MFSTRKTKRKYCMLPYFLTTGGGLQELLECDMLDVAKPIRRVERRLGFLGVLLYGTVFRRDPDAAIRR